MAIMSRRKQAIKRTWDVKNSQRKVDAKKIESGPISEEEHKKRLEKLKQIGLVIKDKLD